MGLIGTNSSSDKIGLTVIFWGRAEVMGGSLRVLFLLQQIYLFYNPFFWITLLIAKWSVGLQQRRRQQLSRKTTKNDNDQNSAKKNPALVLIFYFPFFCVCTSSEFEMWVISFPSRRPFFWYQSSSIRSRPTFFSNQRCFVDRLKNSIFVTRASNKKISHENWSLHVFPTLYIFLVKNTALAIRKSVRSWGSLTW